MPINSPPTITDIKMAAVRLQNHVVRTPLLESSRLNDRLGCRVLIKAECLQRTGSFKFRGAYNKISKLIDDVRQSGVVAFSSGNHAQGVAAAAKLLGVAATIVMPSDAPNIKIKNTRSDGANVVLYERKDGNRVEIANRIVAETGASLIPPYDDGDIIAGQGTVGLEMMEQARETGAELDYFLCPASGGGLVSGVSTVLKEDSPRTENYAVEPENYDDIAQSLAAGRRVEITPDTPSVCDALLLETPGELTFEIMRKNLAGGLVVTDQQAMAAVKLAFQEFKLVLEPSGATALAAVLEGKIESHGKTISLICTGGNVDQEIFTKAIS